MVPQTSPFCRSSDSGRVNSVVTTPIDQADRQTEERSHKFVLCHAREDPVAGLGHRHAMSERTNDLGNKEREHHRCHTAYQGKKCRSTSETTPEYG